MAEPFIGQISMFAGNFAPRGWALCNGQLLDIASHSALFSILGTTYGGDGRTTFGLPDLRGRVPVHSGNGSAGPGLPPVSWGERAGSLQGEVSFTLQPNQIPPLPIGCNTGEATESSPSGNFPALATEDVKSYHSTANAQMGTTQGPPQAVSLNNLSQRDPYTAINFIIALVGLFPSRN